MVQYEQRGAIVRVLWVVLSGRFAVAWAFLAARRLIPYMAILGMVQFVVTMKIGNVFDRISISFDPRSDPATLKHFLIKDAGAASVLLFASYLLMMELLRREGSRYYTTQTEMQLANPPLRDEIPGQRSGHLPGAASAVTDQAAHVESRHPRILLIGVPAA